ncbi:MAG: outer membrane beta-barrel protein [Myxococcota bacterium]|nr:outer membrane beta-barrel protein [Myxococcota bacterium]
MLARKTRLAFATLAVWSLTVGGALAQEPEPKPQTEAEAEARFAVKSKPEPKPQTEPQVEHALSQKSYVRGGWYLGFEGLMSLENSKYISGPDKHIINGGFDFRMGNRHNRWLATEIQGTWINSYKTNMYSNGVEEDENDFMIWGIWINERVYLTKDRIQPFLTGGLGYIQTRTEIAGNVPSNQDDPLATSRTAWGFSALVGVGVEIYWTENFITTVGINYYFTTGDIRDHDFATAGIGFQFF